MYTNHISFCWSLVPVEITKIPNFGISLSGVGKFGSNPSASWVACVPTRVSDAHVGPDGCTKKKCKRLKTKGEKLAVKIYQVPCWSCGNDFRWYLRCMLFWSFLLLSQIYLVQYDQQDWAMLVLKNYYPNAILWSQTVAKCTAFIFQYEYVRNYTYLYCIHVGNMIWYCMTWYDMIWYNI